MNLIIAKQKAHKSKGSNFYVTKQGIKRDFDLMGAKYEYKVYYKGGLYVEDSKGVQIEKPKTKKSRARSQAPEVTIPSDMRDTSNEAANENVEQV